MFGHMGGNFGAWAHVRTRGHAFCVRVQVRKRGWTLGILQGQGMQGQASILVPGCIFEHVGGILMHASGHFDAWAHDLKLPKKSRLLLFYSESYIPLSATFVQNLLDCFFNYSFLR